MKIRTAEFAACAATPGQWPTDGLPEIALAGRSNVGKSSLINRLINRRSLAKTSSTPGKTRTVNFYKLNRSFYLVDLPGFGYAKASRTEKEAWKRMVEEYVSKREHLKGVVVILDIRRDTTANDAQLFDWLSSMEIPILTVLTKADKFKKNRARERAKAIAKELQIESPIIFSALSGEGKDELAKSLAALITTKTT